MENEKDYIDEINEENSNIIDDSKIASEDLSKIQVVSKEWTVETIFSQINQGNINLNPKFQRRNAWNDKKRNQLIESLISGFPIPEIVLAESPSKKKAYIVIDGKQRLSAIAGFIDSQKFTFWDNPKLKGLQIRNDLNGLTFKDLEDNPKHEDTYRLLMNAATRCTIIVTDFEENNDILYHIFYRLNTSSVPLATQELRQVLHKGLFADYLVEITETLQPLQEVMGLEGPDKRLSDIEIILKYFSFTLFGKDYKANLKKFLDDSMQIINSEWSSKYETKIRTLYNSFNKGISNLKIVFDDPETIGRRYLKSKWTGKFNRNLFEALVYYFRDLNEHDLVPEKNTNFITAYKELLTDPIFLPTIESNTKPIESYFVRYTNIRDCINSSYGKSFIEIPTIIK